VSTFAGRVATLVSLAICWQGIPMVDDSHKLSARRMVRAALALVVLLGLWFVFRPEKLFVNKRVDEPPPAALGQMTPLYTGSFHSEAHETSGRATVYQQANGSRVLTLSNFSTSNGPALRVILLNGSSIANDQDLGELKGNQGEQSYVLPTDVDIGRFNTVAIYSAELHAVFGATKLDAF
jgi:hypothetical protein